MSQLEVDKIIPQSGTTLTIGDSGDTISLPSGVSLDTLTITGDLTVDTDTLYVDSTNNEVGIGTTSPGATLHISSTLPQIRLTDTDNSDVDHFINGSGSNLVLSADENNELASSTLRFSVDGSERMRIDSSGNVGIGTTSPSQKLDVVGSIEVSDGIYIGGTAAANKLDDYEEGTWTPTYVPETNSFTSITYDTSFTNGTYVKIGRTVVLRGLLRTDAITVGTATGNVFVGGFPFAVMGSRGSTGTIHNVLTGFVNVPRLILAKENTTEGTLTYRTSSNGVDNALQVSDLGTGANQNYIAFTLVYLTT